MRRVLLLLCALLLSTAAVAAQGQAVTATATVNRVEIHVGDVLEYDLLVQYEQGVTIQLPPAPSETFGAWEVRSCTERPAQQGAREAGWRCELTAWAVGEYELPVQEVRYSGEREGVATSNPLTVRVVTVLDENASDIKPLKPQLVMDDPGTLLMAIGLAVLALLFVAAAAVAYFYWHRSGPQLATAPAVPLVDPATEALQELDRIAAQRLVEQERIPDHAVLIADVMRTYIARRYGVPALQRTTREVRRAFAAGQTGGLDGLLLVLDEADGVKFAQRLPTAPEAHSLLDRARQAIMAAR